MSQDAKIPQEGKKSQKRLSECSSSSLKVRFKFIDGLVCACAYVHVCAHACMHLIFGDESYVIRGYHKADKILMIL